MAIFYSLEIIFGIIINISPSMPLGIYIKNFSTVQRGDIVAICLDKFHTNLGLQRHFLKPGSACNGSLPLIKQVIAIPGDRIELTDNYLLVNYTPYFYKTFYQDKNSKPLAVFPRGIYIANNSYWLIGTHHLDSWDSRYWGPVSSNQIIEHLSPLLVW